MSIETPKGWIPTTLEAVADFQDSQKEPVNSSEREARIKGKSVAELFPYYGATGQVGWIDAFRSEGEAVLLGEDGAPFLDPNKDKAYLVSGRYWVNNHAHILRGYNDCLTTRFLCYQLNTVNYRDFVSGTTRLKLTSSAMKQIPFLLAPYGEQSRIVEKLEELFSDLDAGVAELKAAQKKLAQYRQSLLKAAVTGELTAVWRRNNIQISRCSSTEATATAKRPPLYDRGDRGDRGDLPPDEIPLNHPLIKGDLRTGETGAQLLERILKERHARWEEKQLARFKVQGKTPPKGWRDKYPEPVQPDTANLPGLPEGWVWTRVELAGKVQLGRQRAPQYHTGPNMVPYLRVANVFEDRIDISDVMEMHFLPEDEENFRLTNNDILLNEGQSLELIGRPAIYRNELPRACFTNTLVRFQAEEGILPEFSLAVFLHYLHSGRFRKIAKITTNIAHLGAGRFADLEFPLPSQQEQCEIVRCLAEQMDNLVHQQAAIDYALKKAAAQRQNILKSAFSGQLVPQDPNDEPASALLERIRAERELAAKENKNMKRTRRKQAC